MGWYNVTEYQRSIRPRLRSPREAMTATLIALLPGMLVNTLLVFYCSVVAGRHRALLPELKLSSFYLRNWLVSERERSAWVGRAATRARLRR